MSQDEAQARLEVAQLYHEMGQVGKAVRYYLAAAELYQSAGLTGKAREVLGTILQLEPGNAQATQQLAALGGPAVAAPTAASPKTSSAVPAASPARAAGAPSGAAPTSAPAAGPVAGIHQPTPWLLTAAELVAKIRSVVTTGPDPRKFPFFKLPRLDPKAVQQKAQQMEALRLREAEKARTAVASAFGGGSDGWATPSSGQGSFGSISGSRRRREEPQESEERARKRGAIRGGNRNLAESIAKRLQKGQ